MTKESICRIKTYIQAEVNDAALYRALAEKTECGSDRKLLLEIADDEELHAKRLSAIYGSVTGACFFPRPKEPEVCGSFSAVIRRRVIDESGDFRKYQREARFARCFPILADAYSDASADENVHALRLLNMLP